MTQSTSAVRSRKEQPVLPDEEDLAVPDIHRLLRQLASAALSVSPSPQATDDEHVLLDVEVDEVRCILLRIPPKNSSARFVLSPREAEIARMVAKGYPNKTIAAVLEISAWTVCTHLRRVFAKLGVGSRAAMVAKLLEEGRIIKGHSVDRSRLE